MPQLKLGMTTVHDHPVAVGGGRDGVLLVASAAVLTGVAWTYLAIDAWRMSRGVCEMCMPLAHAWTSREVGIVFVMWTVMMVGMMTPSVMPAVLLFARLNRERRAARRPFVPAAVFLGGYLLAWTIFSLVVTLLQAWLHRAALLSGAMASRNAWLSGTLLVAAGVFQWLPVKNRCLVQCRSPLGLFVSRWRDGFAGAVRMGFGHGMHCVGCCWLLMALLFVTGVMNLLWVGLITVFVLLEKMASTVWLSRGVGLVLVGMGVGVMVRG